MSTTIVSLPTDLVEGETYILGEDHPLYRPRVDELTKPVDVLRPARLEELRASNLPNRSMFFFGEWLDEKGEVRPGVERDCEWPRSARFENFTVVENGIVHIGRGAYYPQRFETIDGVEHVIFANVETIEEAEEAALEEWKKINDPVIWALAPSWATAMESDPRPHELSVIWSRVVTEEKHFTASIQRFDVTSTPTDLGSLDGEVEIAVHIAPNYDIDFTSTDHMREAARSLLDTADRVDAILAEVK